MPVCCCLKVTKLKRYFHEIWSHLDVLVRSDFAVQQFDPPTQWVIQFMSAILTVSFAKSVETGFLLKLHLRLKFNWCSISKMDASLQSFV
jgi:hypothetical protein